MALDLRRTGNGTQEIQAEEIVATLRQVHVLTSQGASVADAIRQIGVSEVTYYIDGRLSRCKAEVI